MIAPLSLRSHRTRRALRNGLKSRHPTPLMLVRVLATTRYDLTEVGLRRRPLRQLSWEDRLLRSQPLFGDQALLNLEPSFLPIGAKPLPESRTPFHIRNVQRSVHLIPLAILRLIVAASQESPEIRLRHQREEASPRDLRRLSTSRIDCPRHRIGTLSPNHVMQRRGRASFLA